MPTTAPRSPRRLGPARSLGLGVAGLVAATFGVGALGTGAAFAQGTHHAHVSPAKVKLSAHERRESPSVRSSETSSNDPNSGDPNEPTDPSSNDPSPSDEGSTDTSSTDVNDVQDGSSVDAASILQH